MSRSGIEFVLKTAVELRFQPESPAAQGFQPTRLFELRFLGLYRLRPRYFLLAAEHADCEGYVDYARRHHEVIARFGRFPHRNAVLGRINTDEETAYLALPGSGF